MGNLFNRFGALFWQLFYPGYASDFLQGYFSKAIQELRIRLEDETKVWSRPDWDRLSLQLSPRGKRVAFQDAATIIKHLRMEIPVEGATFVVHCDTNRWRGMGKPSPGSLELSPEKAWEKVREISRAIDEVIEKKRAKLASERSRIIRNEQTLARKQREQDQETLNKGATAWKESSQQVNAQISEFRAAKAEAARLQNAATRKNYEITAIIRETEEPLRALEAKGERRRQLVESIATPGELDPGQKREAAAEVAALDAQCAELLERLRRAKESARSLNREILESEKAEETQRERARAALARFDLVIAGVGKLAAQLQALASEEQASANVDREWKRIHAEIAASALESANLPEQIRALDLWHLTRGNAIAGKAALRDAFQQLLRTVEAGRAEWENLQLSFAGDKPAKAVQTR